MGILNLLVNMTNREKEQFLMSAEKDIIAKSKSNFITGMDWEDIAQMLRIVVWNSAEKYDEKRASKRTFIHYVIQNALRDLYRASRRIKRYGNNLRLEEVEKYNNIKDPNWQMRFVSFIFNKNDKIWG